MSHKEYSVKMKNISDNLKLLGCISLLQVRHELQQSYQDLIELLPKTRSDLEKVALKKSACKKISSTIKAINAHIGPSLRFKPYQKDEGKKARSLN